MKASTNQVTVAAVQMCPQIKRKSKNLNDCFKKMVEASRKGATLIAFPELTLSGYIFENREEALSVAETVPGSSTEQISQNCASLDVYVVIGLVEEDDGKIFNTAVLIGPEGIIGKYRKTHLPKCGVDRFVDKGNIPYEVFNTSVGKLGLQICYDVQLPEGFRCLAVKGAEIIVNIVNYPEGVEFMPNFVLPTRVIENHVHLVACDRVGIERGVRFIGNSMIIDADSNVLARASDSREEIVYGRFDISKARHKKIVIKSGENEIDLFGDRRPELYDAICQPKSS